MGQRVNIQYSVELDELDVEVSRLFKEAMKNIDFRSPLSPISLGTEGLQQIELIRTKLAKADIMLGDIQNIIEGYVRFKTQPEEPRVPDSSSEAEELEIEQLQDKIQMFKKALDENSNQESTI